MIINDIEKIDIQAHLNLIRIQNERTRQERIDEIYEKVPRIEELNKEIACISVEEAKNRIRTGRKNTDIEKQINEKTNEKKKLLTQNGYPEDYLEPIYECSLCKDWGEVNGKPCSCVKRLRINELYQKSNLNRVFEVENFNTFNLDYYSNESDNRHKKTPHENAEGIFEKAKNFVENFDKEHGNILIYGSTGIGKTFISNCIAKALLDDGKSVLYLSANEMFEQVLSNYIMSRNKSDAVEAIYQYIYSSDLLIIDDLGTEVLSSFVKSQLFEIINKRMLSNKSVIITTNLSLETLQDRYTERVMSRIAQGFTLYPLYGEDIRYIKNRA